MLKRKEKKKTFVDNLLLVYFTRSELSHSVSGFSYFMRTRSYPEARCLRKRGREEGVGGKDGRGVKGEGKVEEL